MKWIPKYQKAGKLNFKTAGLPWQQSKQDQETARNAQSTGTLNPTNLKNRLQPAAKNLKAKYNNLSVKERIALAKRNIPHSEIVTVRDQQGNTKTSTNPQAGAMSGSDPVGEFIVGTAAGNLGLGLGKIALSKMGQNTVSHWARNSLLNETAGNLTKNVSKGITNNLAAKEYTTRDNPIMQLSYYKPTRKAWSTGKAEGNEATSYFFKQQPNQRFELVKDIEPNNYSVHFKTDRNGLSYGNKMQLFAKVADEVPEGANLSTWGSISKGGIHGINRFGKDFGFVKVGERQITDKKMNPVNIPIFEKPFSKEFYYKHGVEDLWNDFYQNQQKLSAEFPSSNYYEFIKYPYLVKTPNHQLAYGRVNSKQATQYYNEVIKPKISLITSEQPNVTDYAEATTLPKNIGGIYNTKSRVSNINMPTKSDIRYNEEGKDIASTLVHENYSHGTDDIIPKFIQEKYPVIPKGIEMNLNGHRYLPASHQWYESRATLNEIRFNNPYIKGDQWMNMPENELLRQLWKTNGYGNDFYHYINTLRNPWKKDFIDKLKFALSYLPASTGVPILSMPINSSNNKSNKNQTTK